jgi:hypothetical protein
MHFILVFVFLIGSASAAPLRGAPTGTFVLSHGSHECQKEFTIFSKNSPQMFAVNFKHSESVTFDLKAKDTKFSLEPWFRVSRIQYSASGYYSHEQTLVSLRNELHYLDEIRAYAVDSEDVIRTECIYIQEH